MDTDSEVSKVSELPSVHESTLVSSSIFTIPITKATCPHGCTPDTIQSSFRWDSFPDVVCICLRTRDDRYAESLEQFHRVGLCCHVQYYRPDPDRTPNCRAATRGVWESHRDIIMRYRRWTSQKHVLIFEDDVWWGTRMTPAWLHRFTQNVQALHASSGLWDVMFLGHCPFAAVPVSGPMFHQLWRVWAAMTHAMVVNLNGSFAAWLTDTSFDDTKSNAGIDIHIMFGKARSYAQYPMVAFQSESVSSNPKEYLLGFVTNFILRHSKVIPRYLELWSTILLPWLVLWGISRLVRIPRHMLRK